MDRLREKNQLYQATAAGPDRGHLLGRRKGPRKDQSSLTCHVAGTAMDCAGVPRPGRGVPCRTLGERVPQGRQTLLVQAHERGTPLDTSSHLILSHLGEKEPCAPFNRCALGGPTSTAAWPRSEGGHQAGLEGGVGVDRELSPQFGLRAKTGGRCRTELNGVGEEEGAVPVSQVCVRSKLE